MTKLNPEKLKKHDINDQSDWYYIDDNDYAEEIVARCMLLGCDCDERPRRPLDREPSVWITHGAVPHTVMFREGNESDPHDEYMVWQVRLDMFDELVEKKDD